MQTKRRRCIAALVLLALLACVQPFGDMESGGLALVINADPASFAALDAGRIRVMGPTTRDTTVSPGASVTISGLAPGTYNVALEGLATVGGASVVANYVETGSVNVVAGTNTPVSVPSFPSFVANVTAPTSTPSRTFTVSYTLLTNAVSYRVEAATNATFTQDLVFVTAPAGQSSAAVTTGTDGNYYVRVRGVTPSGAAGQWSAVPQVLVCLAGSATFNYTGAITTFTAPACARSVTINAFGAQGGTAGTFTGGLGARMQGTFTVTGGQVLRVLVGGAGANSVDLSLQGGGSGGGGTFVTTASNSPLVVAGGGGGACNATQSSSCIQAGVGGTTATAGSAGSGGTMAGGTGGGGGTSSDWTGWHGGSGGGGLTGNGINNTSGNAAYGTPNTPGLAFVNGGAGGTAGSAVGARNGGFGGGGAAGFTGGGGGGYSGGGAGGYTVGGGGGGGGSFNGGTAQTNQAGVRAGNGQVIITW